MGKSRGAAGDGAVARASAPQARPDPANSNKTNEMRGHFSYHGIQTRHVEWSYVTYDLIVIGSGPGGYSAAVRAGQYGLKTAIIEKDAKLGGTCLHVGCIPTKALLHTAEMWSFANHSADEGITIEKPVLNYPKVIDRKNGIVQKHAKGVEFLMKKNKVEWIKGFGTIKRPGDVKVEVKSDKGTQTLETKNILIATGSEARMLPGLKPDAGVHPHQHRNSEPARRCRSR